MCWYCGCREIPLIRAFIAEHEAVSAHAGELLRALDAGDVVRAQQRLELMAAELRSHWDGEERGLFAVMSPDPEYRDYIAALVAEHRELDRLLAAADLADADTRGAVRAALAELVLHIAKEEDGLFPASLTALDADQWNAAIAAWQAVHPGAEP
ncbi:hemerythrin domain-containing protein [Streptacidiphilus sp. N1-3]|uniref:Hemerythrin domain-containing protein n=1 Tax=Streptacidiphilus alkalitolerans TaxID=3342712 RepID=A0ABV6X374_9ACTN